MTSFPSVHHLRGRLRPPPARRPRAALTALLCLLMLPGLMVLTSTSAQAQPGQSIGYRDPTDGHDHSSRHVSANNATNAVFDTDNAGPDSPGTVYYSAQGLGEPDLAVAMEGQNANENEASAVLYGRLNLGVEWVLQEQQTSGLGTGYQYLRYRNNNTGNVLYRLQITPSGSTEPQTATYRSQDITAQQRERIIAFHDHVVDMRTNTQQIIAAGAGTSALMGVAIGALQEEGASFSAMAMACAGVVVPGSAGIVALWIRFLGARKKAASTYYEAARP